MAARPAPTAYRFPTPYDGAVPTHRSPLVGTLIVLSAASLFATLGPLSRFAYERGMEPIGFVAWRVGLAALALAVVVWWRAIRSARAIVRPSSFSRTEALSLGVAVACGLVLNLAIFGAFERTTVALALLGFYTYPAMIAALAVVLGREALTRAIVAALAIAVGGMVLVLVGGVGNAGAVRFDVLGILLALTAAAMQTVFVTASRGFQRIPADQAMWAILAGTFLGCVVLSTGLAGPDNLLRPIREPGILPILGASGVLGAAIPSLLFLVGIRLVGGTRAGILMLFEPVVGVALAAFLLSEGIGPVQAAGGAAILAAAVILQRSPQRPVTVEGETTVALPSPGGP